MLLKVLLKKAEVVTCDSVSEGTTGVGETSECGTAVSQSDVSSVKAGETDMAQSTVTGEKG